MAANRTEAAVWVIADELENYGQYATFIGIIQF